MVSKLTFKGDKKRAQSKSVRGAVPTKKQKVTREEELVFVNNRLIDINSIDPDDLKVGWSTANVVGDLNGPALIIPLPETESDEKDLKVLAIGESNAVRVSDDLDFDDSPINFNSYEDNTRSQKAIPKHSSQVFVLNSVLNLVGSKEEIRDSKLNKANSIKLSVKSKNNLFLNVDEDDLKCEGAVLTDEEIFEFIKVNEAEKVKWKIQTLDGRKLYLLSNGTFKLIEDKEDVLEQYFRIRVHIENTVRAKQIKLLLAEK